MDDIIYWDYNATAPVRASVRKRVTEAMEAYPGNPSSTHCLGQKSRAYIETVRRKIAESLGADPSEILFTGSATETNYFALRGFWTGRKDPKLTKVLASRIDHPSVCKNLDFLCETEGVQIVELPREPSGRIDLEALDSLLTQEPVWLVSLHGASNETGILQPWREAAQICERHQVPIHSDMVQYFGRKKLWLKDSGLNSATVSFHKSGGIRACSVFYLKHGSPWTPCLRGGGQEKKRWAGTENVLGVACIDALVDELDESIEMYQGRVRELRDEFERRLKEVVPSVKIVGEKIERLPNTSFCIFPGIASDAMLMALDVKNVCASAGSACSTGLALPSETLTRLGYSEEDAQSAIRFSLGESSHKEQIARVIEIIRAAVSRLAA